MIVDTVNLQSTDLLIDWPMQEHGWRIARGSLTETDAHRKDVFRKEPSALEKSLQLWKRAFNSRERELQPSLVQ
ncbi:MAG: hypothetical protein ACPG5T_00155 [Endozoicomonas sp.]